MKPASALLAFVALTATAWAGDSSPPEGLLGAWRVQRMQQAPWIEGAARLGPAELAPGDGLLLSSSGILQPASLACQGKARRVDLMPEELFHGELGQPARDARRLGLPPGSVDTLRIECGESRWDFHRADDDSLMFSIDGRIVQLGRGFGTRAPAEGAAGTVQRLLETHFAGSMRFEPDEWEGIDTFLSAELRTQLAAWFDEPWPQDLPTAVRNDPLVHGDEAALRFHVRAEDVQGGSAAVTVDIIDSRGPRRLIYAMQRENGAWRLMDLHDETGESLTDSLVILPD